MTDCRVQTAILESDTDFVRSLFNVPSVSDVIVIINGVSYHLMSAIIKRHSAKLMAEINAVSIDTHVTESDTANADIAFLTKSLQKLIGIGKKTLTITISSVNNSENITSVLKYLYSYQLDINLVNMNEIYLVSTRLGIERVSAQCAEMISCELSPSEIMSLYKSAVDNNTPLKSLYEKNFRKSLILIPLPQIIEFTNTFSYESIVEIGKMDNTLCTEDIIYEILNNWCKFNSCTDDDKRSLMLNVKLESLSSQLLVETVKHNTFIDKKSYEKALEDKVLSSPASAKIRLLLASDNSNTSTKKLLALGSRTTEYIGYRKITQDEIQNKFFKNLFVQLYRQNNGIFCLCTMRADYLNCDGRRMMIGSHPIRFNELILYTNNIVPLSAGGRMPTWDILYSLESFRLGDKTTSYPDDVSLYIDETMKL